MKIWIYQPSWQGKLAIVNDVFVEWQGCAIDENMVMWKKKRKSKLNEKH